MRLSFIDCGSMFLRVGGRVFEVESYNRAVGKASGGRTLCQSREMTDSDVTELPLPLKNEENQSEISPL